MPGAIEARKRKSVAGQLSMKRGRIDPLSSYSRIKRCLYSVRKPGHRQKRLASSCANVASSSSSGMAGSRASKRPCLKLEVKEEEEEEEEADDNGVGCGGVDNRESSNCGTLYTPIGLRSSEQYVNKTEKFYVEQVAHMTFSSLKSSEIGKPSVSESQPALVDGVASLQNKSLTTHAAINDCVVRNARDLSYVMEDVRARIDLALAWLCKDHSNMQALNCSSPSLKTGTQPSVQNYNSVLCTVAKLVMEITDPTDRDMLLTKLYLDVPLITKDVRELLSAMTIAVTGLNVLRELVILWPSDWMLHLTPLLVCTVHENTKIRAKAIRCVMSLNNGQKLWSLVEEYATRYLGFLRFPSPPGEGAIWNKNLFTKGTYSSIYNGCAAGKTDYRSLEKNISMM